MANVKSGAYREIIIDRCLQSRRGHSTQEIFDKCNAALERRNETPITALNTIRNDILAIEEREDGSAVIAIEVIPNFELKQLLLSFGDRIEVLSPAPLREEIHGRIKNINRTYPTQ